MKRSKEIPSEIQKFDRFTAIETTIDNLIAKSLEYSSDSELGPLVTGDLLCKLVTAQERMLHIEQMKRENMESISGTTRRIVFDLTVVPPREPGIPSDAE
jgi:hypothetical protein